VTTAAVAVPLSTLVPMKHMFLSSVGELSSLVSGSWNFSTGSDSPVRLPWLTKTVFGTLFAIGELFVVVAFLAVRVRTVNEPDPNLDPPLSA
jgi:hypothetical protein